MFAAVHIGGITRSAITFRGACEQRPAKAHPAPSLLYTRIPRRTLAFAKMRTNIPRDMLLPQPPWSRAVGRLHAHNATPTLNAIIALRNRRITKNLNRKLPALLYSQTPQIFLNDPSAIGIPRSFSSISKPRLSITRVGRLPQASTRQFSHQDDAFQRLMLSWNNCSSCTAFTSTEVFVQKACAVLSHK